MMTSATSAVSDKINLDTFLNKIRLSGRSVSNCYFIEDVLRSMTGIEHMHELRNNIPGSQEFFDQFCAQMDMLGISHEEQTHMQAEEEMFPPSTMATMMALTGLLGHAGMPTMFPMFATGNMTSHDTESDEESHDPTAAHTYYPLQKWFKHPDRFAKDINDNHANAIGMIQSFCSRYDTHPNIVNKITDMFNQLPFPNILCQSGQMDDIIAKTIVYLNKEGISRGSFKRDCHKFAEAMTLCEKKMYKKIADCSICGELPSVSFIVKKSDKMKKIHIMFKPYKCDHYYCKTCLYGFQTTYQGDYCASCREPFDVSVLGTHD